MSQYLLSVWHDDSYEFDFSTPEAQRVGAQVGAFNAELQSAGAWVFAAGLHPAASTTVVRSAGGEVSMNRRNRWEASGWSRRPTWTPPFPGRERVPQPAKRR